MSKRKKNDKLVGRECATEGCDWVYGVDGNDTVLHYMEEHDGEFPPKND